MRRSGQPVPVTVRIAGEDHAIRADADPEHIRSCARMVDARIQELRGRSGLVETHRASILAALSIADELLRAQIELARLRRTVEGRDAELARQIEAALEDG
jgi:cell division protein ZapA